MPADRHHRRGLPCSRLAATTASTHKSHGVAGTGTICYNICTTNAGASPSGKAAAFGAAIRRFESFRPSLFREASSPYYEALVV